MKKAIENEFEYHHNSLSDVSHFQTDIIFSQHYALDYIPWNTKFWHQADHSS